jgi:hypothetical protein
MCNLLGNALDRHQLPESKRTAILEEVDAGLDVVFEEIKPKQLTDERGSP